VSPGYSFGSATDKAVADPTKREALLDFTAPLVKTNT